MTLDDLRQTYGHAWTIRSDPPGATRKHQLDTDADHPVDTRLVMTLWAKDVPDLAEQLAEQERIAADAEVAT